MAFLPILLGSHLVDAGDTAVHHECLFAGLGPVHVEEVAALGDGRDEKLGFMVVHLVDEQDESA